MKPNGNRVVSFVELSNGVISWDNEELSCLSFIRKVTSECKVRWSLHKAFLDAWQGKVPTEVWLDVIREPTLASQDFKAGKATWSRPQQSVGREDRGRSTKPAVKANVVMVAQGLIPKTHSPHGLANERRACFRLHGPNPCTRGEDRAARC
jgi:hypothetical protein